MKKKLKFIILIIFLMFAIIFLINNNEKKFMQDGVLFAVLLDGNTIDYFPERGNYNVVINCKNANGKWLPEDWKLVIENIKGNVSCNLDFNSKPSELTTVVEKKAQLNENGYRYTGSNPDNYIWFNNEMWRIIGSIPTKKEDGTTENMVKIIRDGSLGNLVYNKSSQGISSWGDNSLYLLLNQYYYGKSDGTENDGCFSYGNISRSKCDYRYNGIKNDSFYGEMIENVYWNTGNVTTSKTFNEIFEEEISNQTIIGNVGLMSVSDFLYSSENGNYSSYTGFSNYSDIWLSGYGDEWVISNGTGTNSGSTLFINNYAKNFNSDVYTTGKNIRPVVYLDPSVFVVSGTGTEANPYQIAM